MKLTTRLPLLQQKALPPPPPPSSTGHCFSSRTVLWDTLSLVTREIKMALNAKYLITRHNVLKI